MFAAFFSCPVCREGPAGNTFPLCNYCQESLIPAPPLCPTCAGPICGTPDGDSSCKRPWITHEGIRSFSALYLLVGTCYRVLRKWKYQRGLLLSSRVLNFSETLASRIGAIQPDVLVPIPQLLRRSWELSGSPADQLASWLSSQTAIRKLPLLERQSRGKAPRQTQLSLRARLENRLHFQPRHDIGARIPRTSRILLVDDFMTTGHTLRAAAGALKQEGFGEIHVFCLGVRPPKLR